MATSSITTNFYCDDAKAYLPSEYPPTEGRPEGVATSGASFASIRRGEAELPKAGASAMQSGYSSANAFVRMLVSPVKDSPSRRARAQLLDFETEAEKRDFVRRFRAKWSKRRAA